MALRKGYPDLNVNMMVQRCQTNTQFVVDEYPLVNN